jgi:hypothetical protein
VGDYPITVTLGTNPNYAVTPVNGILSIKPGTTVTADAADQGLRPAQPVPDVAYSGFLGTDNASDLDTVTVLLDDVRCSIDDVGGYAITSSRWRR